MEKTDLLARSLVFIFVLYGLLLFILFLLFQLTQDLNLFKALLIIVFGNLIILAQSQLANWYIEKNSYKKEQEGWLFQTFIDCVVRSFAGLAEMAFYTLFFAFNLEVMVAGYLLLKTITVWKDKEQSVANTSTSSRVMLNLLEEYSPRKREGLHGAILRISIVISLVFSLWASYYLFHFLEPFQVLNLEKHSVLFTIK